MNNKIILTKICSFFHTFPNKWHCNPHSPSDMRTCFVCLSGSVTVTSIGEVTHVLFTQGARGPDGPTGEVGSEGKKVRMVAFTQITL